MAKIKLASRVQQMVREVSTHLPNLKKKTVADAEQFLKGLHILPGTLGKPAFVGNPPDWFANPFNDIQYVCSLNRMFHWPVLLRAYSLTGDRRFALEVVNELRDWISRCPRPTLERDPAKVRSVFAAVDPWSALEVGIRMYETWPTIRQHLAGTEFLTPELEKEFVRSVYEQAEVLAEIGPILDPHADGNHHLMIMLGLFEVAVAFPEFDQAAKWKSLAIHELVRCADAQLTKYGAQIEACPHYHALCIYWFCLAVLIGREHGIVFPDKYLEKIRHGLDYCVHSFRSSGTIVPMGDSDADMSAVTAALFGWLTLDDNSWLGKLAVLADPAAFKEACHLHVWRAPDITIFLNVIEKNDFSGKQRPLPLVNWQRDIGQAALRTGWDHNALSVLYSCRTPVFNGHAHIDPMGFDFSALGRPLIVDPGRYCYREDNDRRNFKSAAWHNTLSIDGREPFEYLSSWNYGPQKEGKILWVAENEGLPAAEAIHYNYEPIIHRRLIALFQGRYLLVFDYLTGLAPDSTVQLYWHFDSTKVRWNKTKRQAWTEDEAVRVSLTTSGTFEGELLEGKVSDAMDVSRPSTRLRLNERPAGPALRSYLTLIAPFRANETGPVVQKLEVTAQADESRARLELQDCAHVLIWQHGQGLKMEASPD